MGTYYKPQSPIQSGEDFIYPITTADQVKVDKDTRLNAVGVYLKNIDNSTDTTVYGNNATTLGGVAAEDYALKTDTAPDSSKLGGKAPEYYIQPRNLLDNSDFKNPVNQRGATTTTQWGYCIDRWLARITGLSLSTSQNGLTISSDETGNKFLYQKLPQGKSLNGKTVTVAICDGNGDIVAKSLTLPTENKTTWTNLSGDISTSSGVLVNITDLGNGSDYPLIVSAGLTEATNIATIKWVALYEGSYTADTLPPYVPKGYAAELAECRRYYKRFTSPNSSIICAGYVTASTKCIYINALDNYPMRIDKPSCSFSGNITVRGIDGYIAQDYSDVVTRVYANATGCISMIEITRGDSAAWNATNNTPLFVTINANSVFELLADL